MLKKTVVLFKSNKKIYNINEQIISFRNFSSNLIKMKDKSLLDRIREERELSKKQRSTSKLKKEPQQEKKMEKKFDTKSRETEQIVQVRESKNQTRIATTGELLDEVDRVNKLFSFGIFNSFGQENEHFNFDFVLKISNFCFKRSSVVFFVFVSGLIAGMNNVREELAKAKEKGVEMTKEEKLHAFFFDLFKKKN